jgi:putative aldouronate transport system permease protein
MLACSLPAYVLTTKEFKHKGAFTAYFSATMFFNGGMIPLFLVIRALGLWDSIWAIVVPPALSAWTIILYRTNFRQIPESLSEAAKMDGASHGWIYIKLVLPLSKAIIAVLSLFAFVGYWNAYFPALMYLTSQDKQPLMIVLRKYVVVGNMRGTMESLIASMGKLYEMTGMERALKMATIFVAILPVVVIYPFIQKYMTKGTLVGSIKE